MADEKEIITVDADTASFIENIKHAHDALHKLGDVDNLKGLVEMISRAGVALGIFGAAALALKVTWESVFEAEQIKALNQQFEILTENAGIMAEDLKEGMEHASAGLLTTREQLELTNKAVLQLGVNAARLPELMDAARKLSQSSGKGLTETFEGLNRAIMTGSQRMFKHLGVTVDIKKAYIEYGKEIGVVNKALTKEQEQAALVQASLAIIEGKTKGTNVEIREATNAWTRFKVSISELGEAVTTIIGKVVGPTVTRVLNGLNTFAKDTKNILVSTFGEGKEQATANLQLIESRIERTRIKLAELEKQKAVGLENRAEINTYTQLLAALEARLVKATESVKTFKSAQGGGVRTTKGPEEDLDKQKKQALEAEKELEKIHSEGLKLKQKQDETVAQADATLDAQKIELKREHERQLEELNNRLALNEIADDAKTKQIKLEMEQNYNMQVRALSEETEHRRQAALNQSAKVTKNTTDGFTKQWKASANAAQNDSKNWGKTADITLGAFKSNSISAFAAFGDGSKSAGDAAKGFLFGSLGDIAMAEGELHVANGIASFNPIEFAEGGVLISLGSWLKSQGKGGGSSPPSGGGGGGGLPTESATALPAAEATPAGGGGPAMAEAPRKSVSINIAGHFMGTDETNSWLVNQIRQATDATDFSIKQIGER